MADSARIRTVSFCPRVYKKPRSTHAKLSWVDLGLIASSGMLISQGATMYSTRSGATPRIASLMAELGKSAKPPRKRKGGRKAPWKGGRGPAAPPLRAPCPRWGRTRPARARRPVLPRTGSAVLWAMAGLAAEFGMGSGDPRLRGRARAGRPLRVRDSPGALAAA